jgi:hypothetical protein
MLERLKIALDALGYGATHDLQHQSSLIHAIQVFALVRHDDELEAACDEELEHIRQQVLRRPFGKT